MANVWIEKDPVNPERISHDSVADRSELPDPTEQSEGKTFQRADNEVLFIVKDLPGLELSGKFMFYCPSCEVLLGADEAYEHTHSHRDKGPNVGAVLDTFKKIPVAEPTTAEWNNTSEG